MSSIKKVNDEVGMEREPWSGGRGRGGGWRASLGQFSESPSYFSLATGLLSDNDRQHSQFFMAVILLFYIPTSTKYVGVMRGDKFIFRKNIWH